MRRILGSADTAGTIFNGPGGESLIVVDHATGSNLTIEAHEPKDNFTEFLVYAAWSSNNAFTATELGAFPTSNTTVTEPTDELFDIVIPDDDRQRQPVPGVRCARAQDRSLDHLERRHRTHQHVRDTGHGHHQQPRLPGVALQQLASDHAGR